MIDSKPKWHYPDLISIPAGKLKYLPAGEFYLNGDVVDPPVQVRSIPKNIKIMKFPVSIKDYSFCVKAGKCEMLKLNGDANSAQTGVNFFDAKNYADWVSIITDEKWRLPSDVEWMRAAAENFFWDGLDIKSNDPSKRWIKKYKDDASREIPSRLLAIGAYGENSMGLVDLSGAVWEWTNTCMLRGKIGKHNEVFEVTSEFCGVRLVEGRHRAFMVDFIRDPQVGGCSQNLPPHFLGFRLIRQN